MTTVNLESDIAPPEEKQKKPRGRKSIEKPNPAKHLLAALKFVSLAQKKIGPPTVQFSFVSNGWIVAFDGILTIAHKIEEDLEACPNTFQFIEALSKVDDELSITQLSTNSLCVTAGKLRALVACVDADQLAPPVPDPCIAALNNDVKAALGAVAGVATEGAHNAAFAGVLLQANTAVATNGHVIAEAWHGVDLPPNLLLPKVAALAVAKSPYSLTGFGFSQSSVTFYFENDSIIKTQLFPDRFPVYEKVFDSKVKPEKLSEDFFKAVETIANFSKSEHVYLTDDSVASDKSKERASVYKIKGLTSQMVFKAKQLLLVKNMFDSAAFDPEVGRAYLFGENCRGVVQSAWQNDAEADQKQYANEGKPRLRDPLQDADDDIPF